MCEDLDAGRMGPLEHRHKRVGVVRHDRDDVHLPCDQVLDGRNLLCRICLGRTDHPGFRACLDAGTLDADLHRIEPGDPADLGDDRDFLGRGLGPRRKPGQREQATGGEQSQAVPSRDHRVPQ